MVGDEIEGEARLVVYMVEELVQMTEGNAVTVVTVVPALAAAPVLRR